LRPAAHFTGELPDSDYGLVVDCGFVIIAMLSFELFNVFIDLFQERGSIWRAFLRSKNGKFAASR
jgi:hypothetical protein